MAYKTSEENLERQRLLGKVYGHLLDKLMDSLVLPPGIRCLDLGCGLGETTRQLATRLESSSEVVGVDFDPVLLDVAREISSEENFEIRYEQGDANNLEFEDQSFGIVFARSLLMHMSKPEDVLSEMLRVCKSGGIVAVQEGDLGTQYCYPRSWAYEKLPDLWGEMTQNAFIGRKLWSLFQQVGYSSANVSVDSILELEGNDLKRYYRLTFEGTGPAMMKEGLISEDEFEKMCEEFKRVEQAESVLCLSHHFFSGWVIRS